MKKRFLWIWMLTLSVVAGCCGEPQAELKPKQTPQEVLQLYLEAVKKQDGLTMAEYTTDHSGIDFTISEQDAKTWGLHQDSLKKLYAQLLNFTYTCDDAIITETTAEIKVHVQAYDIQKVLADIVAAQEETFQEINGDDFSEADKNQKIADIIIDEFRHAERSRSFELTMHLQLTENEWLTDAKDGTKLTELLFAMNDESGDT